MNDKSITCFSSIMASNVTCMLHPKITIQFEIQFENYTAFTVCPFWSTLIFGGTNKVTFANRKCLHRDSTPLVAIVCAPRLHPTFWMDWARCGSKPGNPDPRAVRWRTAPHFQHRRGSPCLQGWTRPFEPPIPSTCSQPELRWMKQSDIFESCKWWMKGENPTDLF